MRLFNYKPKCLICKCRKWFIWGKFCRQCLKENDVCSAGPYEVTFGGEKLGTSEYITINNPGKYAEIY